MRKTIILTEPEEEYGKSSYELDVDLKLKTCESPLRQGETRTMDVTCVIPHEVYEAVEKAPRKRHYSTKLWSDGLYTLYERRDGSVWLHMHPQCLMKGGQR